jgi:hypothetical protein
MPKGGLKFWFSRLPHKARRLFVPQISNGYADWCGRFFIIHAPPSISRWFEHGEIGLYLFRWQSNPRPPIGRVEVFSMFPGGWFRRVRN